MSKMSMATKQQVVESLLRAAQALSVEDDMGINQFYMKQLDLVKDPNTDAATLAKLYSAPRSLVTKFLLGPLAQHKNLNQETITKMSRDKDPSIRRLIAHHPSTPLVILRELARDSDADVRHYAVLHKNFQPLPQRAQASAVKASSEVIQSIHKAIDGIDEGLEAAHQRRSSADVVNHLKRAKNELLRAAMSARSASEVALGARASKTK